uniref:hypothetical protein n=1 Tax=Streptomyces lonarensis TaxID=700599 RepID=UPI0035E4531B
MGEAADAGVVVAGGEVVQPGGVLVFAGEPVGLVDLLGGVGGAGDAAGAVAVRVEAVAVFVDDGDDGADGVGDVVVAAAVAGEGVEGAAGFADEAGVGLVGGGGGQAERAVVEVGVAQADAFAVVGGGVLPRVLLAGDGDTGELGEGRPLAVGAGGGLRRRGRGLVAGSNWIRYVPPRPRRGSETPHTKGALRNYLFRSIVAKRPRPPHSDNPPPSRKAQLNDSALRNKERNIAPNSTPTAASILALATALTYPTPLQMQRQTRGVGSTETP